MRCSPNDAMGHEPPRRPLEPRGRKTSDSGQFAALRRVVQLSTGSSFGTIDMRRPFCTIRLGVTVWSAAMAESFYCGEGPGQVTVREGGEKRPLDPRLDLQKL